MVFRLHDIDENFRLIRLFHYQRVKGHSCYRKISKYFSLHSVSIMSDFRIHQNYEIYEYLDGIQIEF